MAGARAEMQERNRAAVLAAARAEFVERGYRDAKVDVIASKARLTRGAVYSNFPSKRALYFAVLAADAVKAAGVACAAGVFDAAGVVAAGADTAAADTAGAVTAGADTAAADTAAADTAGADVAGANVAGANVAYVAAAAEGAALRAASTMPREAMAAFAASWLGDLPLATDVGPSRLAAELLPVVLADERTRRPFAQLTGLTALLVGLALERLLAERTFRPRMVRVAEAALTLLHGAGQLAAAAPGFVDEMVVVDACAQLAEADFADRWAPPHLPYVAPARPVDMPFRLDDDASVRSERRSAAAPGGSTPADVALGSFALADPALADPALADPALADPALADPAPGGSARVDAATSGPARADAAAGGPALGPIMADGVLVVLGLHRLTALEEAVRAAPRGVAVTAAIVTGEPAELGPLARLVLADTDRHLGAAFPPGARPIVRIVLDEAGALAAAAGVTAVSDATETAVRLRGGRIVARADGPGAPHAAASFT